jgi:hypothetical protein
MYNTTNNCNHNNQQKQLNNQQEKHNNQQVQQNTKIKITKNIHKYLNALKLPHPSPMAADCYWHML